MPLPIPWTTAGAQGSQWSQAFQLQNDDGTLMNITGKTFELVLRSYPAATGTAAASVSSSTSTAQGYITVTTSTSTILPVLSPTATAALLASDSYALALWMDPGLPDATALVTGSFYVLPAAAP